MVRSPRACEVERMGDARFSRPLDGFLRAPDRAAALRRMEDEAVVEALAAASREGEPFAANVLATEALNRIRRLRASLAHMGEGVVALDLQGQVLWANPAAERLTGWSRAEMMGRGFASLVQGSGFGLRRALRTRAPVSTDDASMVRRSDRKLCLACTAAPILGPDGDVDGLVLAFSDCTARKDAERALRVSEQRYRSLFENSLDAIVSMEPDGTIADANHAAERLTGVPLDRTRGRRFQEFLHPEDVERTMRLFSEVVHLEARRARLRVLRMDGSEVLVDAMGIPIVVAGEVVGIHGVARPAANA